MEERGGRRVREDESERGQKNKRKKGRGRKEIKGIREGTQKRKAQKGKTEKKENGSEWERKGKGGKRYGS